MVETVASDMTTTTMVYSNTQQQINMNKPPRKQMKSFYSFNSSVSSSAEIVMKEIALLEIEIMHLEKHLLSLYRNVFEHHLVRPSLKYHGPHSELNLKSQLQVVTSESFHYDHQATKPIGLTNSDISSHASPLQASPLKDKENVDCVSRSHSLGDHLGSSAPCSDVALSDISSITPDRLSEDILKCICAIYCKLAYPALTQLEMGIGTAEGSSMPSVTFSSRTLFEEWSPHCSQEKATVSEQLQGLKKRIRKPYSAAIQISKICLDDDTFSYVFGMLEKFRSLVKILEKVDPRKIKREEKLAFWINVHNALVMHAHLAYGTQTHVNNNTFFEAAYNVGGHCINAYTIQNSILGIRTQHSLPWLQTLLSPGKNFKMGRVGHVYAIEYPEPLAHFALCSGLYSDPAVRLYKAKDVFQGMKLAKEEFIRASLHVHNEKKLILPKIFSFFAKDMSLDVYGLLKLVRECLPEEAEAQRNAVTKCLNGSGPLYKSIQWSPQSSVFRYIFHQEVTREIVPLLCLVFPKEQFVH